MPRTRASRTTYNAAVVLVVGDFRRTDEADSGGAGGTAFFASQVWDGVVGEYGSQKPPPITEARLEPLLQAHRRADAASLTTIKRRNRWEATSRDNLPVKPLPLQLSDHRPDFERLIAFVLDQFNVCGVIASGSATKTQVLRRQLAGVEVPVLVTTDTSVGGERLATELRLVPTNQAQATAMILQAALEIGKDIQAKGLPYLRQATPEANPYSRDLEDCLKAEARRLALPEPEWRRTSIPPGVLLVIGYTDWVNQKVISRRGAGSDVTIVSDGCIDLFQRVPAIDGQWMIARPDVRFEEVGELSFAALRQFHELFVSWPHPPRPDWLESVDGLAGSDDTETHAWLQRVSAVDMVKGFLVYHRSDLFCFSGNENIQPRYVVRARGEEA